MSTERSGRKCLDMIVQYSEVEMRFALLLLWSAKPIIGGEFSQTKGEKILARDENLPEFGPNPLR